MTDAALAPKLTAYDERILNLLPEVERMARTIKGVSAHEVAEKLGTDDVADVRRILNGLVHLHHARSSKSRSRKVQVFWREEAE